MPNSIDAIEAALRGGSRAKNFAAKITEVCGTVRKSGGEITDARRTEILRLAGMCRASRKIASIMSGDETPAMDSVPEFSDLFCSAYYPVMEDGKRTVGFWSVKDSATLAPDDVHEWVRDRKFNRKTEKPELVPVPFGNWWRSHRPDYDLYGIAADRARWNEKVLDVNGRLCVNTAYGKQPVLTSAPACFGDGKDAETILDAILKRTITDPDSDDALMKRRKFVTDAGAHLLALRDFGKFRCLKLFCFTSTNGGQGTGKSLLHESIAALVPRDAAVTVRTTYLSSGNLLPLYASSVCILTEAPSTSSERYTAEDVKAFADAGWKTAEEKYVAKRSVMDNSLKLMSSNHLAPLPLDSVYSRRIEFFVAEENDDGGSELRALLDEVQARTGWNMEELRMCIGWAFLLRAKRYLAEGNVPVMTARRTIDAQHLLTPFDYDYFIVSAGNTAPSYSDYRDSRTDRGITWSPDVYRFKVICAMSLSHERWIDDCAAMPRDPTPESPLPQISELTDPDPDCPIDEAESYTGIPASDIPAREAPKSLAFQYKRRMKTAYLEPEKLGLAELWAYISGDKDLKTATAGVRDGTLEKRMVLRQIFPGVVFDRFTRTDNISGYNGLVHVDFDHIAEKGNGLTPAQVRDGLAEMPGFVIGALSSRGDGAWAIFNAGSAIKDYDTYRAAQRSIFALTEERMCMKSDHNLEGPTWGRTLAYDPECRVADEVLGGVLPQPFFWKAPTFSVSRVTLKPYEQRAETTADERVRNERFMEAVVTGSCERIQNAAEGDRHGTAIKAVANVVLSCQERGVTPLSSWGRRLRDACRCCGLDVGETNGIMAYWRQKTGLAG